MSTILEELKLRLAEAQKRLTEATQRLQLAQQEHQSALAEHNIWNGAVQTETRNEQARTDAANKHQLPLPKLEPAMATTTEQSEASDNSETNKTEIVRQLLREHQGGMSPTEIWRQVNGQFKYRAYLYSVLKRLRDRDEVVYLARRKKYALKGTEAPAPINLQ